MNTFNINDYKAMTALEAAQYIVMNPGKQVINEDDFIYQLFIDECAVIKYRAKDNEWRISIGMGHELYYKVYPEGSKEWACVQMWMGKIITWGSGFIIFRIFNEVLEQRYKNTVWHTEDGCFNCDKDENYRIVDDFPRIIDKEQQLRDYEEALKDIKGLDHTFATYQKAKNVLEKYGVGAE